MDFKLGRAADNDEVIKDEYNTISRYHLECNFKGDYLSIKDVSSGGTFVNGNQMVQGSVTKIKESDILGLGKNKIAVDVPALFKKYRKKKNEHKMDFTAEFAELIPKFIAFEKKKKVITDGNTKKIATLKVVLGVIVLIAIIFAQFDGAMVEYKLVLMLSIGLIGGLLTLFFGSSVSEKKEELQKLESRYSHLLVCPKCEEPIFNKYLAVLREDKKCPNKRCNAIYLK